MRYFPNIKKEARGTFWPRLGNILWEEIIRTATTENTYFWTPIKWKGYCREIVGEVIKISDSARDKFGKLFNVNGRLVVIQVRWGNHRPGDTQHFPTPASAFIELLDKMKKEEDFVLYLASESIKETLPYFQKYNPITQNDFGFIEENDKTFMDYYAMTQANVLIGSNSTFSWCAALVNEKGAKFIRPDEKNNLVECNPWEGAACVALKPELQEKNLRAFQEQRP